MNSFKTISRKAFIDGVEIPTGGVIDSCIPKNVMTIKHSGDKPLPLKAGDKVSVNGTNYKVLRVVDDSYLGESVIEVRNEP